MDDKKKSVDFWSGSTVDLDAVKAIKALQEKVTANRKNDPTFYEDAPRLTLALATKPRTADSKPEHSIFQAFKGFIPEQLKGAMVKMDATKNTVTFAGFSEDAKGLVELDAFLTQAGALRRTVASRSKGWAFVSDTVLASTPKLSPTERVGSIPGAKQISIALPPAIAGALPSWASAAGMVGFFVECGRVGLTLQDLEAYLADKRAEKDKAEKDNTEKDNTDNAST